MATFKTSPLIDAVRPSATMVMTQKARDLKAAGRDVISLSVGAPDFDTPDHIRQAAKAAMDAGETRYTATDGTPALKEAIRQKFARDNGLGYSAAEIVATSGGKYLIFAAMMASLQPGDEVIIPAPYWVSYPDIVRMAGGVPVIVPAMEEEGFIPTAGALQAAMSQRTRWLFLNSPNNPTGAVMPKARLLEIGEMLAAHPDVWVMTDDIYEHLSYGEKPQTIAAVVPALKDRTLIVNGASKAYAMTGWRIGFGAGPEPLMAAIRKLLGQTTSNPCSIAQAATVAALNGEHGFLEEWKAAFRTRRDLVVSALEAIDGLTCQLPEGAFYCFPSCAALIGKKGAGAAIENDVDFCTQLLEAEAVAAVPGTAFGAPGYFRVSYATGTDELEEALRRIARFVASLG